MNRTTHERLLGIAAVLVAAILWGTTGTAATFAPEVSAVAIGAAAMGGGGLMQAALSAGRIRRHAAALRAQWHYLLLGAVAVAIYPLAFYASMRLAGVTIGTVVSIGSAPLLSALIQTRLDGLRLTRRWMIGAGLGLAGMLLLGLAEGSGHVPTGTASGVIPGVLLGLVAGLAYALYSWTASRLMQRGIASRAAMGATFGIGGLLLLPVLLVTGAPLLASWGNASVGLYMALVPMFLGYLCFGHGLARIPASTATTITLFEPVVAAGLAVVIVGERLPAMGWAGILLILACLVCISAPVRAGRREPSVAVPGAEASPDTRS
ncbi:drug/metabolite transporter, DME family [Halomonas shengliensis]|uniref:Drug/metabolite transporter, DME family n=1 Tax=Halomonas shengliensis TaxID=419597 RepID=A0A1H0IJI8_9GAMM|nr:EamA family transporter [Halomonas shengliensis]SDO31629.1 drug/metabolite transporter, DME family [Halomonas shengliensis]